MAIVCTTPATAQSVSTADAKLHMHVDAATEDTLIATYIAAAENFILQRRSIQAISATWKLYLDEFPDSGVIELPIVPVSSITSIAYVDTAGDTQALAASKYLLDTTGYDHSPCRVTPAYGESFPATREQINAVTITFVAGYGAASANVPGDLRAAILLYVADRYANREATISGTIIAEVPLAFESLISMRGVTKI